MKNQAPTWTTAVVGEDTRGWSGIRSADPGERANAQLKSGKSLRKISGACERELGVATARGEVRPMLGSTALVRPVSGPVVTAASSEPAGAR